MNLFNARQLVTIMSAQSVSTYANQVIALTVPWLVLTRTGNAASAGTVAFAMGIAAVTGTLAGGVVTDRIGGRRVSMLADSLSLVTALALAGMLWFGYFSIWFVAVTQVLGVFFDGPGSIAKVTAVPAAAADEDIPMTRAMGLTQTLQGIATFLGPITAGLLIGVFGEANTLLATTVLFFVSVVLASRLRRQTLNHDAPMSPGQVVRDMREAVDFLRHEPFLGKMQLVGPLMGAVIVPIPALVFPAWFVFGHQDPRSLGIFLGAGAIGGMVGGIAFSTYAEKLRQRTWLVSATAVYAVAILAMAFVQPGSKAAIALSFTAGLMLSVLFAVPFTAFYSRTPQELLGRVGSLGAAQGSLMGAASSLGIGWLMHTVSAPTALVVCAAMMGAIAVALATMPFMRLLDAPGAEAEPQPVPEPELAYAA